MSPPKEILDSSDLAENILSTARPIRILALCDSPAVRPPGVPNALYTTGFARVVKSIFSKWCVPDRGLIGDDDIDIWALNFDGWGYENVPWRLFPAPRHWNTEENFALFLNQLVTGGYTHVWILANMESLSGNKFPQRLKSVCSQHNIRSMLYFPCDCEPEPEWTEIVAHVDVAVSYTEIGAEQTREALYKASPKAAAATKIHVLPHGCEVDYAPSIAKRADGRESLTIQGRPYLRSGDFLILNVNKNEWRKDLLRTFEIVAELKKRGVPVKLVLRTALISVSGGINLMSAAKQLGLEMDVDWVVVESLPEEQMPYLYNAADLCLTTTLGEGWGLSITDALACGTPVAMPTHSACGEIFRKLTARGIKTAMIPLEPEFGHICGPDGRVRQRVDLELAVDSIERFYRKGVGHRSALPDDWLSWGRIADEMWRLLMGDSSPVVTANLAGGARRSPAEPAISKLRAPDTSPGARLS